jgi:hypothetical protein
MAAGKADLWTTRKEANSRGSGIGGIGKDEE